MSNPVNNPEPDSPDSLDIYQRADRNIRESAIGYALLLCTFISVLTTLAIVYVLASETVSFFGKASIGEFLFGKTLENGSYSCSWTPQFAEKSFCVWPTVNGTLIVALIAMLVATPLGLATAVYLSEYAPPRLGKFLRPVIELLAGVPTVVYGYFALTFITPILGKLIPGLQGFNALSAGLIMGVMIVPTIGSISTDAMIAVPRSLREAAYGLGSTKKEVTTNIVFPAALSGICAAIILGISRAVGETMIVAIAAGQRPILTLDPRQTVGTMTAYIAQVAKGDSRVGSVEYEALFAVGMTLFLITLLLNIISKQISKRFQETYE
ncbi:MAG: phosphate ABC transporter permease subunit PstC [Pseudanabaena sp.]|jgi:phosphate transport system permease protein|uniref:phosphate ABC transporter permease subunit PstC n=1 Tax=Pseudanabaena mucicola TaxID=71190 RepID=UPI0025754067|nr:phosphate ABC transporter permease subunit PstC [Pseudanabaena mucicola]MCA6572235.1 phosphate ABC transporter permease subunit PstC [Pseudanabaena sp. M53BS1SP1A06MG]MCA6580970.1 phosphate ABC transporter permease subunit PstC [Pseudanabaena sp. M34BS1SP1A06MG]MCA6592146.1 phosphate ABC transporter permease subunit PstC [Pseudanabaena sp. M38BS1SP1A06MG]MCA6597769.1 phosphate ABC transporter permease subunit PstC [Pseudanabaena sp. M046S1SP1A06QC]MCA6602087.1 phosphate ABC transporter perm